MSTLVGFMQHHATLVLFVCICLGYLIGSLRLGRVRLGGVCGTLLVAMVLGQADVEVAPGASQVAFALFIFSLGYVAGPQFVASFRREDLRLMIFPVVEVVAATALVLGATALFGFGPGVAAGLFAGATSQSAALGTAAEALDHIGLSPAALGSEQADLASAYSLCYLCGLITIVVFSTQLAPAVMRIDVRAEAVALAQRLRGTGRPDVQLPPDLLGRVHRVGTASPSTVAELEARIGSGVLVSAVLHEGQLLPRQPGLELAPTDLVQLVGRRQGLASLSTQVGEEVWDVPLAFPATVPSLDIMITRGALSRSAPRWQELASGTGDVGVVEVRRHDRVLETLHARDLQPGDVLTVVGPAEALRRAGGHFGKPIDRSIQADWAYLGGGLVVGVLIGLVDLRWGPLNMTVGTGGGVLLAGLLFGWFRMRRSTIGAYAPAAAEVIKDLGLTIFVGVAGLTGAPRVAGMIRELGLVLPSIAVLVSAVPAIISLLIARRVLRLPAPLALGAVAGQQCSTPAVSVLQQVSGNDSPLLSFVKIYAVCNVVVPLVAPLVVAVSISLAS